jgi:hypothetical protein
MLQTYAEFRPTAFDPRGLGLEDQQSWLVVPVGQNRDSGPLERSNFRVAQKILDDAGVNHEVHRFGHWGPGWFEIILVEPTEIGQKSVEQMIKSLADYPVLDDMDLGAEELEDRQSTWENCYESDIRRAVDREIYERWGDDGDSALALVPDLRAAFEKALEQVGGCWECGGEGSYAYKLKEAMAVLVPAIVRRYARRPVEPRAALRYARRCNPTR